MKNWLWIFGLLFMAACSEQQWHGYPSEEGSAPLPTITLEAFGAFCSEEPAEVPSSMVLSGYVISSDKENNFYRSLLIDDGTGAVEILTGMYDLHNSYPLGQRIVVVAGGLMAQHNHGVVRIGIRSGESMALDYMEHRAVVERYLYRMSQRITPQPKLLTPAEINEGWLGRLVQLDHLTLSPMVDTTWAVPAHLSPNDKPQSALLKFKTTEQDSIYTYTSGYAAFAGEKVPQRKLSLVGILYQAKVGGAPIYQLKMRDENDILLD